MYLESKVKDLQVVYFDYDLQIKTKIVRKTALINIASAVEPSIDYKTLWKDIAYNGMRDPIIIIQNIPYWYCKRSAWESSPIHSILRPMVGAVAKVIL